MDKELQKNFQQRSAWIFATLVIILIGASPACSDLVLDFLPHWKKYQGFIKLVFITMGFLVLSTIYWKEKKKEPLQNHMSDEDKRNYCIKELKWDFWKQNIFRNYPLNIITLKIIPLFICWIIM